MNPLDQLKDIHAPQAIGWWPLAWGWWVLIIILTAALLLCTIWLVRRYQFGRARKQALIELARLQTDSDAVATLANQILKRTCIRYFSRERVAALSQATWCEFLARQLPVAKRPAFSATWNKTLTSLYQSPGSVQLDNREVVSQARIWLLHANLREVNHV